MKNLAWHKCVFTLTRAIVKPIIKHKMKYEYQRYPMPDKPCLILANHTTDLDPALVSLGISKHCYFLASEHAFRAGFGSRVLKMLYDPIAFNKVRTDISAIKQMIFRMKNGANICLFPEGNRTFTGATMPFALSVTKLAKASGADIITFRIEGGYLTSPRWSKTMRKGKMFGRVVRHITQAELADMTEEQVLKAISTDIYEDAYVQQGTQPIHYCGKRLAEHIETALFLCPQCEGIGTLKSKGNQFYCDCGLAGLYTETGHLEGDDLPFSQTTDWGIWQSAHLASVIDNIDDRPICSDTGQALYKVHHASGKVLVGKGDISINHDALHCCGMVFPLENIMKFAVVGQMTLLFAEKQGDMYEVRSQTFRSALKYKEIFRVLTKR
ncbi:MAG: 1-acyl-sn-glycerol-3-phosphate acyltransferase [Oscillospiraceae bacterium]|nr:1-acyl-sn-glycerol-3-phosphate acyltransferase [Oscillospiraceae bacterium]